MPKKKQPRNAFYFFMLDYKQRCERNGEKFPNGLRDVQLEAGPEWDALPASQRKVYEDMAKAEKSKMKAEGVFKQTCCLNSFKDIDINKSSEEQAHNEMINYIEEKVGSLSTKNLLAEYKFYLVHVNYFCVTEGECYHPAELAISEFSIGEGVTNVYNTIINPGDIPLGYRHDAMVNSEKSHKIPVDENEGEKNFYVILENVKRILEPGRRNNGGSYPPMFSMPDNVNLNTSIKAVKSVMSILCNSDPEYDRKEEDYFKVYPLDRLFFELAKACNMINRDSEDLSFPTISIAHSELEKDVFNFTANIACPFHYREDAVEFCSKSYVQRWVFLICDLCTQDLGLTPIPGKHLPSNADVNFRQRKMEEQKEAAALPPPKPVTWVAAHPKPSPSSSWVPRQEPPLPRPQKQANLAAMLPPRSSEPLFNMSEDNFPSIPVGRGRGKQSPRGAGRGNAPLSFAAATKK